MEKKNRKNAEEEDDEKEDGGEREREEGWVRKKGRDREGWHDLLRHRKSKGTWNCRTGMGEEAEREKVKER